MALFAKNHFPAIFGSHLEFLRKMHEHIHLGRYAILTKFLTPRVYAESFATFSQKMFSLHFFDGHLEFLRKTKKLVYLRNPVRAITTKYLAQGIYGVIWHFLSQIVFKLFLAAIFKFCIKCKSEVISKAVCNREISTKF